MFTVSYIEDSGVWGLFTGIGLQTNEPLDVIKDLPASLDVEWSENGINCVKCSHCHGKLARFVDLSMNFNSQFCCEECGNEFGQGRTLGLHIPLPIAV